tara:strand:+ start:1365 stop:3797 length:2433 start_codon:yes stop_codon:yes gene_type:complete
MGERIVSPGVFTRERDLSFLPQGVANIDAAIVGPTLKGPSFVPTQVTSFSEFENIFGSYSTNYYTPYTIKEYLKSAGSVKVVRVGYLGGYKVSGFNLIANSQVVATFLPSINNVGGSLSGSLGALPSASNFTLNLNGANATASLSGLTILEVGSGTGNFIANKLPTSAGVDKIGGTSAPAYMYKHFRTSISASYAAGTLNPSMSLSIENHTDAFDFSSGAETVDETTYVSTITGNSDSAAARTPYIHDQDGKNLFKIYMRSDGTATNENYVVISGVKRPQNSNSSPDYAEFGLAVYSLSGNLLQAWSKLNMDPSSPNFVVKAIGDQFQTVNDDGEISVYGEYANLSTHIRIGDYNEEDMKSSKASQPMGHDAILDPVKSTASVPAATNATSQTKTNDANTYNANVPYGFKIDAAWFTDTNTYTNKQYLAPIPKSETAGSNVDFNLTSMLGFGTVTTSPTLSSLQTKYTNFTAATTLLSISSSVAQLKFTVPFQHGFDGIDPARSLNTGNAMSATNTMGHDCSTSTASGSVAYKRAINAVSNPDEIDINMLVTPGIVHSLHPSVTNHAIDKVEARADAFYVMDGSSYSANVSAAVSDISALDTNYVATYFPWVKMDDPSTGKGVWVPPSVVIPGVIAFTDRVAHEWFAPAGLNRGGLSSVRMAKKKLTHTDRDTLYDGRVNPIATFPGQGVVVFGQKTLQAKPSALDRINVRRLLIKLKKFISSSSRYLVFEQNDSSTRARFLNIVNPFLESVQANSGLSAFKVVMDDSNNTPDVIDRNQLVGQIFIQPTRTAEFIVLDFTVMPTGAAFPE